MYGGFFFPAVPCRYEAQLRPIETPNVSILLRSFLEFEEKQQIVIPTLLFYELANACLQNAIPAKEISRIMELLQKLPFEKEDIGYEAFRKIYQIASEYKLTYYDASYVTLMQKHGCELVTADEKLFKKLHGIFADIRLL